MNKMVYLAHPIDSHPDGVSEYQNLASQITRVIGEGVFTYTPSRAWSVSQPKGTDPRLQETNNSALENADVVVALLRESDGSIGVGLEIQQAVNLGIPVIVAWDNKHWALANTPAIVLKTSIESVIDPAWWSAYWDITHPAHHDSARTATDGHSGALAPIRWTGDGVEPGRAHDGDAGYDLFYHGREPIHIGVGECADIPAQIHMNWPPGVWGFLVGRSSSFRNRGLLVNPAVIDTGFTGQLFAIVRNVSTTPTEILPGERVAQIVPLPNLADQSKLVRVESLDDFEVIGSRGQQGFGSSGL